MDISVAASYSPTASVSTPQSSGGTSLGLEAQLEHLQKQLADCETCASASTPEGKKQIKNLHERIGQVEARLKTIDEARGQHLPDSQDTAATKSPQTIRRIDTYA